jgi:HEAT repeat protein
MKRQALMAGVVICILFFRCAVAGGDEPSYEGQGLSELAKQLYANDAVERGAAAAGLANIGEPAIPALVKALHKGHRSVQAFAAAALGEIGPKAQSATPDLISLFDSGDAFVSAHAIEGLSGIGAPAVPALTAALTNSSVQVRAWSTITLGRIGTDARAASLSIARGLSDSDVLVRVSSADALRAIGARDSESVEALRRAMADDDLSVRLSAAIALAFLDGSKMPEVRSVLDQGIVGAKGREKFAAATAILKLDATSERARNVLIEGMRSKDVEQGCAALIELKELGGGASFAIPALIEILDRGPLILPVYASKVIAAIGPPAGDAVPRLIPLLSNDWDELRQSAAEALGKLGAAAKPALPMLEKLQKDKKEKVRVAAAEAIKAIRK